MSTAAQDTANLLRDVFAHVALQIDGAQLVRAALAPAPAAAAPTAVLAIGKVAFPMFEGFRAQANRRIRGLLVAPASLFPSQVDLPTSVRALVSDHPNPTERSVAAGTATRAFVESLHADDRLLVLLSGGGSSLVCSPADGLTLDLKRTAVTAVARGGATIAELNAVRKHLSGIKGGQLALRTQAAITLLALSDVVGNDPGTIASGPFSPDDTTFAQAAGLVRRLAPGAPAAVLEHLDRGARGERPETPKPGNAHLARVDYRVIADPDRVTAEASAFVRAHGPRVRVLSRNVEASVESLADEYSRRGRAESGPAVWIGNGEPTIRVTGNGKGGRATHLALLMARALDGHPDVAFLAAGTDDRDGSSRAAGAVIDGTTWSRAVAAGLDPEGALRSCDSERPLDALGCLVTGPGTSNLLDLHLLGIGGSPRG